MKNVLYNLLCEFFPGDMSMPICITLHLIIIFSILLSTDAHKLLLIQGYNSTLFGKDSSLVLFTSDSGFNNILLEDELNLQSKSLAPSRHPPPRFVSLQMKGETLIKL